VKVRFAAHSLAVLMLAAPLCLAATPAPSNRPPPSRASLQGPGNGVKRAGINIGRLQVGLGFKRKAMGDGTYTKFRGFIWNSNSGKNPNKIGRGGFGRGTATTYDPHTYTNEDGSTVNGTVTKTTTGGHGAYWIAGRTGKTHTKEEVFAQDPSAKGNVGERLSSTEVNESSRNKAIYRLKETHERSVETTSFEADGVTPKNKTITASTAEARRSFLLRRPTESSESSTNGYHAYQNGEWVGTTNTHAESTKLNRGFFNNKTTTTETDTKNEAIGNNTNLITAQSQVTNYNDPKRFFPAWRTGSQTTAAHEVKSATVNGQEVQRQENVLKAPETTYSKGGKVLPPRNP
jgi:hypothetical protein